MSGSDSGSELSETDQQPVWARRNTDTDTEVTQDILGNIFLVCMWCLFLFTLPPRPINVV